MGNRANICIKSNNDEKVYLYTHWSADDLPNVLRRALRREQRWYDGQYLARIIFCEMVKDDIGGETGYGISSFIGDGRERVLTVDTDNETVRIDDNTSWSFREYCALTDFRISNLWRCTCGQNDSDTRGYFGDDCPQHDRRRY